MIEELLLGLAILTPLILGMAFFTHAFLMVILVIVVLLMAYAIGDALLRYRRIFR